MNHPRSLSLASIIAFGAITTGALASERDAHADVSVHIGGHVGVRIGGRGGVHVGGHGSVHWRVTRPAPPPRQIHVGGAIWVGGGYYGPRFAAPPPPPVDCDCDDGGYYGPVRPAPAVVVAPAAAARAPLPRFGLGVAAGGVEVSGQHAGSDLALLGRFRLTPGLAIEGEIGKEELANGKRVDRRVGASLVYELHPYNRWAPYAVAGLGASQVDIGGGQYQSDQRFAEVGVGLRLALSTKLHLAADIRAGSHDAISSSGQALCSSACSATPPADGTESYTRMRVSALLFF